MTKPTAEQLAAAERAIARFPFWDYGMDDLYEQIRTDRQAQEWIPVLAGKVAAAAMRAEAKA